MPIDPGTLITTGLAIMQPVIEVIHEAIKRNARRAARRARRIRAYNEIATGLVLGNDRIVSRGFSRLWDVAKEVAGE